MRQKKSNLLYYVIGLLILATTVFVVIHEVPMESKKIEQEINVIVKAVEN